MEEQRKYYGGALFPNDRKTSDKAPDYSGDFEIDPETWQALVDAEARGEPLKFRIAGWIKQGRRGDFISTKGSPMQRQGGGGRRGASEPLPGRRSRPVDDDIPY